MLDAVILSDIHLGSANCQAKAVCALLERIEGRELPTERVILNGDVFDSIDFRRLTKHHWRVLSLLRKLSDQVEIIWVAGNHDGSAEVVSHLLGVTVLDEYVLESGEARHLVLHGHQFDSFITKRPLLTALADAAYRFLQWIAPTHHFAKMAKHGSKSFLRNVSKIAAGAVALAYRRGCTGAICGHTHHAVVGPDYSNSGCWTELPCTYLTVADGLVSMHAFQLDDSPSARVVQVVTKPDDRRALVAARA
ncbi:MAG: UDP-2,3-diacylglucosamine diphosphatase [Gemmataceae bacterium]|nr:UDP-2,3-diacylglucosamine diphosphatase [Gemmataceae bacterium]